MGLGKGWRKRDCWNFIGQKDLNVTSTTPMTQTQYLSEQETSHLPQAGGLFQGSTHQCSLKAKSGVTENSRTASGNWICRVWDRPSHPILQLFTLPWRITWAFLEMGEGWEQIRATNASKSCQVSGSSWQVESRLQGHIELIIPNGSLGEIAGHSSKDTFL